MPRHFIRNAAVATFLAAGLAACATAPADTVVRTPTPATTGTCSADAANRFVGQTFNANVLQQIRQASGAQAVRVFRPGQTMGTTDHHGGRLNIHLDGNEAVQRLNCG